MLVDMQPLIFWMHDFLCIFFYFLVKHALRGCAKWSFAWSWGIKLELLHDNWTSSVWIANIMTSGTGICISCLKLPHFLELQQFCLCLSMRIWFLFPKWEWIFLAAPRKLLFAWELWSGYFIFLTLSVTITSYWRILICFLIYKTKDMVIGMSLLCRVLKSASDKDISHTFTVFLLK